MSTRQHRVETLVIAMPAQHKTTQAAQHAALIAQTARLEAQGRILSTLAKRLIGVA